MSTTRLWLAVVLAAISCGPAKDKREGAGSASSAAQDIAPALGALTFQLTEGTPQARAHFSRGLLALHSFWYDEATREFQAAAKADPTMNLAHWGVAMSHLKLLWGEDDLTAAHVALKRMPDPEKLSPREQEWVYATLDLLKAPDVRSSRRAYAQAMARLYAQFPDDEAATFLAIALLSTIRPEDPNNLAIREKAASLAAKVYANNPNHPGAAHYLLHAYDTPELAGKALDAAKAYSRIAPAAFHARHMPAHIFTRLGMWSEAIASCRAAWDASVASAKKHELSANHHDFHSLSWLMEMPFELGKRSEADAYLKQFAAAVKAGLGRRHRAHYANQVGSYLARTAEWKRVDELLAPLASPAVEDASGAPGASNACGSGADAGANQLVEELAVLNTRALAAAMQHDLPLTKRLVAELETLTAKIAPTVYANLPTVTRLRVEAAHARKHSTLLARAANDDGELLRLLRETAEASNLDTGGENNPSAFVAYEELGDALLRMGKHAEAADAYAHALAGHPRRASSLLGAARAAAAAGNTGASARFYRELGALWKDADPTTPGLAEVRAALN